MSQFKTTSSISASIAALVAQGEVVGEGWKEREGKGVEVLEVKKKDAKQKSLCKRVRWSPAWVQPADT